MFELVKSKVNLLEVLEKDLQVPFKISGENTYSIEDEREYGGCPFCSHNDCFKVKHDGENLSDSFFKCFSCDAKGSVIDWVSLRSEISLRDACLQLAKDYKIDLPKDYSPVQELLNTAATYYETCFKETCNKSQLKLSKMTPMEYQLRVRKHQERTISHFHLGWSDGGLIEFLNSLGYDKELLEESGLINKKTGRDFLPQDCFIYPHYFKGKVSHFTFKDPFKKINYQLPNKYVLNGQQFYNQESVKDFETIIIVEGENDLLSVWENTTKYGVIATIGQISTAQLDWLRENLGGKHLITMFDPDEAGDKYRVKLEKIRNSFKSLVQIKPGEDKDIDDHLTSGADLGGIIASGVVKVEVKDTYSPPISSGLSTEGQGDSTVESSDTEHSIFEKYGCYYKVKYKDSVPVYTKISNFTLQLKNVYITDEDDREREVIVVREDGYTSKPFKVNSEIKVSLKAFRVLLARAADCDFFGTDFDLMNMWSLVYSKSTEVLVHVSRVVGRHDKHRGWIFANKFISDTGVVVEPDESGIFWLNGKTIGLKAESLNKSMSSSEMTDVPVLVTDTTPEQRDELLHNFINYLALNFGDMGLAIYMVAWMNACAYSNSIHPVIKGFPMLFIWSSNGQGKGTIGSWLMNLYGQMPHGKTTVTQLKTGVGFARKMEYYSSLPTWVDEIRNDKDTHEHINNFRDYFDRSGRSMGAMNKFGIITKEIRSCALFAGEDYFEDPATKERCLMARIPVLGRETVKSFAWMEANLPYLSSIGYKWILESVNEDHKKLIEEIRALDKRLILEAGCSSRKSKLWSIVGVFAFRLAAKYAPDFNIEKYIFELSAKDSANQKAETTTQQFFERVESIMSQEGIPKITNSHIIREGSKELHIWFPHVYRVVDDSYGGNFAFSKAAVLASLREEPYFISDNKKISMGSDGIRRVVITLDLEKCPDVIKNIGQINK